MAGRPGKTSSSPNTGKLWSILSGMGGADSGVKLSDPAAEDKELVDILGPEYSSTENDSNTLSVRPTATPTHWWNKGRANDVNNQLIMQDYQDSQNTANAVKQSLQTQEGLIPIHARDTTATGEAETGVMANRLRTLRPENRINATDKLMTDAGIPIDENSISAFKPMVTADRLSAAQSAAQLETGKNDSALQDILMQNKIKDRQFPLSLGDVQSAFQDRQKMEDAKILQTQNEANRSKYLSTLPGAEIFDTSKPGAPAIYNNPLKPTRLQEMGKMIQDLKGSSPSANVIKPITSPTREALPRSIPQNNTVDYSKDQFNVTDPTTKKKGSIIGGKFIPYANQ